MGPPTAGARFGSAAPETISPRGGDGICGAGRAASRDAAPQRMRAPPPRWLARADQPGPRSAHEGRHDPGAAYGCRSVYRQHANNGHRENDSRRLRGAQPDGTAPDQTGAGGRRSPADRHDQRGRPRPQPFRRSDRPLRRNAHLLTGTVHLLTVHAEPLSAFSTRRRSMTEGIHAERLPRASGGEDAEAAPGGGASRTRQRPTHGTTHLRVLPLLA
jgi:hypothetical protein